jgi:hypothetical protein
MSENFNVEQGAEGAGGGREFTNVLEFLWFPAHTILLYSMLCGIWVEGNISVTNSGKIKSIPATKHMQNT